MAYIQPMVRKLIVVRLVTDKGVDDLNSVIGEVRVHYELEGKGTDVLILHGWGADVRDG